MNKVDVKVIGEEIGEAEQQEYVNYLTNKFAGRQLSTLTLKADGGYVDMSYTFADGLPFERIRRITGYLVGTLDRFNDGKRAEERDRVKHDMYPTCSLESFDEV